MSRSGERGGLLNWLHPAEGQSRGTGRDNEGSWWRDSRDGSLGSFPVIRDRPTER